MRHQEEPAALDRKLLAMGFDIAVGVPDSTLTGILGELGASIPVHVTPREDTAVAVACGLALAGARPVVYMKNAGLMTAGDALLSLARDMEVPLFLLVGWAGSGEDHLPHHVVTGERTTAFLEGLAISWRIHQPGMQAELAGWHQDCSRRHEHSALLIPPGGHHAHEN